MHKSSRFGLDWSCWTGKLIEDEYLQAEMERFHAGESADY